MRPSVLVVTCHQRMRDGSERLRTVLLRPWLQRTRALRPRRLRFGKTGTAALLIYGDKGGVGAAAVAVLHEGVMEAARLWGPAGDDGDVARTFW